MLWLGALTQLTCEQPVCSFSCYEVNLRGCLLQDLLVSFSRPPGSLEEESFICRLGEIQVCMWELDLQGEGGGWGPSGPSGRRTGWKKGWMEH